MPLATKRALSGAMPWARASAAFTWPQFSKASAKLSSRAPCLTRVGMVFLQKCLTTESRSWVSRRANLCSHLSKIRLSLLKLSGSFESVSQSVSQLFHGPAPRSPLHRLAVRLRHSQSNTTSTDSIAPAGATQKVKIVAGEVNALPADSDRVLPVAFDQR